MKEPFRIVAETDWLGTNPIFYHEKTGQVGKRPNDVVDWPTLEFDPDGLRDYLDFGYCVFGHTPVRHVRYLPPCTRLEATTDGRLIETRLADPALTWSGRVTDENELLETIRNTMRTRAAKDSGPVVIPTSGGLDSRLLNALWPEPKRIRAFTYGISDNASESEEVVAAQQLANTLGLAWRQVELGPIHRHLDRWDDLFGLSTHAHGMYHFEFYDQIHKEFNGETSLISGLIGDLWAGAIAPLPLNSPRDLQILGYTHGLHAQGISSRLQSKAGWREEYWANHADRLKDPQLQLVELVRFKMMLLRYLLLVPNHLGFAAWSPFIIPEIALGMLHLPAARRKNRVWQRDFFTREGLVFESSGSRQNSEDLRQIERDPPPALNIGLLSQLFDPGDVETINQNLLNPSNWQRSMARLKTYPLGASVTGRLGIPNKRATAYAAYCTLRPIERLLEEAHSRTNAKKT